MSVQRRVAAMGLGVAVWLGGWVAMVLLDGPLDLANLALVFVLTSVVSALWLPSGLSVGITLVAALGFNWLFVPPRGTFAVELPQHAVLLASMVGVSAVVAMLMAALRNADDPLVHTGGLRDALAELTGKDVALLIAKDELPAQFDAERVVLVGEVDADQQAALWHCLRQGEPMGPGTHRHRELPAWYLPMLGRGACRGAALVSDVTVDDPALRAHAQALCNEMGSALQRVHAARAGSGGAQCVAGGDRARSPHATGHHHRRRVVAAGAVGSARA